MKKTLSKVGFRLRALRKSRGLTQESLAARCQQQRIPISRCQLARYEIGYADVPARLIPVLAHVLRADITDLLPPIGGKSETQPTSARTNIRNLTGQQIREFRRCRRWTQKKLARTVQEMGAPITREIIANLESQRTRVKDYQLVFLAKALQIPLNWLFPNSTGPAPSTQSVNHNSSLRNALCKQQNKARSIHGSLARVARKISKFAKRFMARS